jgi:hypothetical protein
MTSPMLSTATHSVADGHEIPVMLFEPSMWRTVKADAGPAGSVVVSTSPTLSTAPHHAVEWQEIQLRSREPSMRRTVQVDLVPSGPAAVTTSPGVVDSDVAGR